MFTSVCADNSCVYEVSQKLFLSFATYSEAKMFVDNLIESIRGLSINESYKKIDETEEYNFTAQRLERRRNHVVLRLTPEKAAKSYDLFIGH